MECRLKEVASTVSKRKLEGNDFEFDGSGGSWLLQWAKRAAGQRKLVR